MRQRTLQGLMQLTKGYCDLTCSQFSLANIVQSQIVCEPVVLLIFGVNSRAELGPASEAIPFDSK